MNVLEPPSFILKNINDEFSNQGRKDVLNGFLVAGVLKVESHIFGIGKSETDADIKTVINHFPITGVTDG